MKDKLIAFLVSKAGGVLTPLIAAGIAALVSRLAMIDPSLAESVDQVSLTGFIVAFIISLVNYFTNEVNVKGVKKIQALVNTDKDGVARPVTYTEIRRAIKAPKAIKMVRSKKK
jgi:small-conductance mechanosensitive channel